MNPPTPRLAASLFATLLCSPLSAQVTQMVSVSSSGVQGNGISEFAAISADGRYVAFESSASNLVAGDTNSLIDVFVHDRETGTTEKVSVNSSGVDGNQYSFGASISADGRYVAFESLAGNLVPGDTNDARDIFLRDRQLGTTELVSLDSGGAQGNSISFYPSISADGRYVAFQSYATNLVPGDTNGDEDVFVRDRQLGTTERVSLDSGGAQGNYVSFEPSISADGRFVEFISYATNLVPGDTNGAVDVFLRDRQLGKTERASVATGGAQGNYDSGIYGSSISADGRYVAFQSYASNLVSGDTNGVPDVFVRDRQSGATERVSVDSGGAQGNGHCYTLSISADGRYVAFQSYATNLVPGDTNGDEDVFVRDRQLGTTERVSLDSGGAQGNDGSDYPSISADGRFVAFESYASNLVAGDTDTWLDVFVRDRNATGFEGLCDPGSQGVAACPCANTPAAPGHGCDNSSSTGGAILSASGVADLSMDSLVFTTSGEKPTALSLVFQGDAEVASGAIAGQGVSCAGGTLRRLYVKRASGGSISAPDIFAGDLYVTEQSTALGDPIQAGESRWYVVVYRDPMVLGGCPAESTFNSTQTGKVTWSL